ncbi:insulinase family protein [Catenovulum sediminis]|uniref:Protease 3 n=1 Tax=Catenovulum sediminis TaxID=1740262 RepID=A0ABV1RJQ3_9ALTE
MRNCSIFILMLLLTLSLLLSCATTDKSLVSHQSNYSKSISHVTPIKHENDHRKYAGFTLDNGMQVIVVSDEDLEVAAASIVVAAGAFQASEDYQGLPHYLEHMIFQSSKKYPWPNEFKKFVEQGGGFTNAYTARDHTNYFFYVSNSKFDGALDRLSAALSEPLFDHQYSKKEVQAVHSEWSKQKSSPHFTIQRVAAVTANPQHPLRFLAVGNADTLKDKDDKTLHDEMVQFYNRFYSANQMKLTLVGSQSIDELMALAMRHFGTIKNKAIEKPEVTTDAFAKQQVGQHIFVKTREKQSQLGLEFPIKNNLSEWKSKPNRFLINLIFSQENGALIPTLRNQGLIKDAYYHVSSNIYGSQGTFYTYFNLTGKGEQHKDLIVQTYLDYLHQIKNKAVTQAYSNELQMLLDGESANHQGEEAYNTALKLSVNQLYFPIKYVLTEKSYYEGFNKPAIESLLNQMTIDNLRLWHIGDRVEAENPVPYAFGKYSTLPFTHEEKNVWLSALGQNLAVLPPAMSGSSEKKSALAKIDKQLTQPKRVVAQQGIRAYLMHSKHFENSIQGVLKATIQTPNQVKDVESLILNHVLSYLYQQQLSSLADRAKKMHQVQLKGYGNPYGFTELELTGDLRSHAVYIEEALQVFKQLEITESLVNARVESYLQGLQNLHKTPAIQQFNEYAGGLYRTKHVAFPLADKIYALQQVTVEKVRAHHLKAINNNFLDIFAFGYYSEKQISELAQNARITLGPSKQEPWKYEQYLTPKANKNRLIEKQIESGDNGVELTYIALKSSFEIEADIFVLNQIMANEFFTRIRTDKQMGYVVASMPAAIHHYPAIRFIVQSDNTELAEVEAEITQFIEQFRLALPKLPAKLYNQVAEFIVKQINQKPAKIYNEAQFYLADWEIGQYEFSSFEKSIAAFEKVSKSSIIDTYQNILLNRNSEKLTIKLKGKKFI